VSLFHNASNWTAWGVVHTNHFASNAALVQVIRGIDEGKEEAAKVLAELGGA